MRTGYSSFHQVNLKKTGMHLFRLALIFLAFSPLLAVSQPSLKSKSASASQSCDWIISNLISTGTNGIRVAGSPEPVTCKYGKALLFNGKTDGIFLDQMPLEGLNQFTVEILFCPYSGGSFEQRYLHCGEVKGSRILCELRSTQKDWYLDAFVKSGEQQKTLIEPNLLHPLDQWAHIAFVVENGKQETYVNGKKELESNIAFVPIQGGKTSVGVRQSETSWFKGAIYEIRITGKALIPSQFLKL